MKFTIKEWTERERERGRKDGSDQIGRFLKVIADNLFAKVAQIFKTFWAI